MGHLQMLYVLQIFQLLGLCYIGAPEKPRETDGRKRPRASLRWITTLHPVSNQFCASSDINFEEFTGKSNFKPYLQHNIMMPGNNHHISAEQGITFQQFTEDPCQLRLPNQLRPRCV